MSELKEKGIQVLREMWGPEFDTISKASKFAEPWHDMLHRICFGEVWERPGLSRRDRSLMTLSMLIAQSKEAEFRMHVKAGLNNGLTIEEIQELVLHAMVYCGVPASASGIKGAEAALADIGKLD